MQTGRTWQLEKKYCQLVSIKSCGPKQRAQWIRHLQSEPILTKKKQIRTDPVCDINRERGDDVLSWIVNKLMGESPGSHPDQ